MKHLVHKVHHPHLKKRALLEFIGFFGLVFFLILQSNVIHDSIKTVLKVEAIWFVLLLLCFWMVLPLTALSYKLISPKPKKISLFTTALAHLAGAGPGRIIPGGLGNLSIGAAHLKKTGLTIEQSVGIVMTNNFFGLLANLVLLITALTLQPDAVEILRDNISSQRLIVAGLIIVATIVVIQWLMHARGTKREIHKALRQWKIILKKFLSHPSRVAVVVVISMVIALLHTFMLDFSGFALGIDIGIIDALIALSCGIAIGGIFPTPGGIGGVEAGITAALIVLGYDAAQAASIAVLFRVSTYWQPLIPGTVAYLYLRERKLI